MLLYLCACVKHNTEAIQSSRYQNNLYCTMFVMVSCAAGMGVGVGVGMKMGAIKTSGVLKGVNKVNQNISVASS